jgi:hypothetical protein
MSNVHGHETFDIQIWVSILVINTQTDMLLMRAGLFWRLAMPSAGQTCECIPVHI